MMLRKLKISMGYNADYILEPEDAVRLLEIANRAVRVTQQGRYSGPYVLSDDQEPFISSAELVEFEPPQPPLTQDSGPHLRAARDLP
jgi:hypothetical protein